MTSPRQDIIDAASVVAARAWEETAHLVPEEGQAYEQAVERLRVAERNVLAAEDAFRDAALSWHRVKGETTRAWLVFMNQCQARGEPLPPYPESRL